MVCGADEKIIRIFEPTGTFPNFVNILGDKNIKLKFEDEELQKKLLVKNPKNKHIYKIDSEISA